MRLIYFGTSSFAVPPLEALLDRPELFDVAAVVSTPDKPAGRSATMTAPPVAEFARLRGLNLLQPKTLKNEATRARLAEYDTDAFIVAAYGKILPKGVLDLPRLGCVNLHGSILPKYRGASPIQSAIIEGERETGVTLMAMDEEADHGPTLAETRVPISSDDTFETLSLKMARSAAELLVEALPKYAAGALFPVPQNHADATFTKIIDKKDGLIRWFEEDAERIERKTRAYHPWPGAYFVWQRKDAPLRVKLIRTAVIDSADHPSGTVFIAPSGLPAVAAKTSAVELREIQPEGKKPMTGESFVNGYRDIIGSRL